MIVFANDESDDLVYTLILTQDHGHGTNTGLLGQNGFNFPNSTRKPRIFT
jgi:hypothetical protein